MANHSLPSLTSLYADFVAELNARMDDLAFRLDPAYTTPTNLEIGSRRWNSTLRTEEKWNGTAWEAGSDYYVFNVTTTPGLEVNRTNGTNNAVIKLTTTAGSMYIGNSNGTSFVIDDDSDLAAGPLFRLSNDGSTTINASSASAGLTITQTGAGNALVVEDATSPDSTSFVIDASGNVVVGHTTSIVGVGLTPNFQTVGGTAGDANTIGRFRYSANSGGLLYDTYKSRNATVGSHTAVASGDDLAQFRFFGSDGAAFVQAAEILAEVDGTPATGSMPGRLVFSTTPSGSSTPVERLRIDSEGNMGLGIAPSAGNNFQITKPITGAATSGQIYMVSSVATDVTSTAFGIRSRLGTAAAAFTLPYLVGLWASQTTIGAGSAVTSQYGFYADATLIGATNNYGFRSDIPDGTGRWNFYASGTAANYFGGSTTVYSAHATDPALKVTAAGTGPALLIEDQSSDPTPFTVLNNGIVVVGSTGSLPAGESWPLQVQSATSSSGIGLSRMSADTNAAALSFAKSRSGVVNAYGGAVLNYDYLGDITWGGDDGTTRQYAARLRGRVNGTPSAGNVPGGLYFETSDTTGLKTALVISSDQTLAVGASAVPHVSFQVTKDITGATTSAGIYSYSSVASDVTGTAYGFKSTVGTAAASFALANLVQFGATQNTFGAGSTVTNQYGFSVDSTLTGATNNYGFFANIPASAGDWNFYANGTAANYFAGSVLLGHTTQQTTYVGGTAISPTVQTTGTTFGDSSIGLFYHTAAATGAPYLLLGKSRGATKGAHALVSSGDVIGAMSFAGSDGTQYREAARIWSIVDGTAASADMPGALLFGTTPDGSTAIAERMRIRSDGNVAIGSAGAATVSLYVTKNITGGTVAYGINNTATVQSDVTSTARGVTSITGTAATTFTLSNLQHYYAAQGTIGAGSTVTNQYGFSCNDLTAATNNYGFSSNVSAGTGRWNFYAAGTANNYFAGSLGLGITPTEKLHVSGNILATGDITGSSDARLKSNITPITEALAKIKRVSGYTFNKEGSDRRHAGVIAQEFLEVLPEVVLDSGEYLSVAYGNITALLIEGAKELAAENEKLQAKCDRLESLLANLLHRVELLEG